MASDGADAEENKQSAQSSAHVSPAMRIYRHALESIFALLELEDLSHVLAVCREWSAAVRSMSSACVTIARDELLLESQGKLFRPLPPIDSLVAGPLLRHVAEIQITAQRAGRAATTPLTAESLALLALHAPHLTSLWCDLTLTPAAPLSLPVKLTSLELTLPASYTDAEINGLLTALAAHPSLSCLCLRVSAADGLALRLLGASRSLTDLTLDGCYGYLPRLGDEQYEQIRSSLGHLKRISVGRLVSNELARLLQRPVTARWQDIGTVTADARTGDLLVTLPTLTRLDLTYGGGAPHVDFLSKLPLLSALKLDCDRIPAAPLLASLLPCTGLTELDLRYQVNSAQVCTLLAALTNLRTLRLEGELDSLQCFASGPATVTLQELCLSRIVGLDLPPSELVHLHALQGLRSLELDDVFESLDDAAMDSLSPPSARLPRLTRFVHTRAEDWSPTRTERTGPSFEWMQQRLTQ